MNNEEKILAMLAEIKATQEKHGEILERHSDILERHSEILGRHSEILGRHSEILEQNSEILGRHSEILEQNSEILGRHDETLSDLQKTVTRVAVTQENMALPQLKLLAEGHDTLLNTLARKERVEALEDDVALLKSVFKTMSQRIAELEKAQ